jgi:nicotinamide riboside kinase
MRIAITGSAGTGKTTLAQALATHLGVPYIPDYVEVVLKEEAGGTWKGVRDTRLRKNIRLQAIEKKMKAETEAEAFVSDKSVVDYLAYWILNQAEFETKEQNWGIVELIQPHVHRYTHRLILPFRADIEWGENRNTDPFHNYKLSAMKRGLFDQFGVPVIETPYTFGEDIAAWAAKWLGEKSEPAAKTPAPAPAAEVSAPETEPEVAPARAPKKKTVAKKKK